MTQVLIAAATLGAAISRPCPAQRMPAFTSLMAGASAYDLSGTGTAPAVTLGLGLPVAGILLLEPGATWFRYGPQSGPDVTYLFAELSIQAQARLSHRVSPYVGVGGGRAFQVGGPSPLQNFWTLHGVGGMRVILSDTWGIRGELRVRAVNPFHGNTADFTAGILRFFR
jgi:hypothetical protein